jgi:hypothetical protein
LEKSSYITLLYGLKKVNKIKKLKIADMLIDSFVKYTTKDFEEEKIELGMINFSRMNELIVKNESKKEIVEEVKTEIVKEEKNDEKLQLDEDVFMGGFDYEEEENEEDEIDIEELERKFEASCMNTTVTTYNTKKIEPVKSEKIELVKPIIVENVESTLKLVDPSEIIPVMDLLYSLFVIKDIQAESCFKEYILKERFNFDKMKDLINVFNKLKLEFINLTKSELSIAVVKKQETAKKLVSVIMIIGYIFDKEQWKMPIDYKNLLLDFVDIHNTFLRAYSDEVFYGRILDSNKDLLQLVKKISLSENVSEFLLISKYKIEYIVNMSF